MRILTVLPSVENNGLGTGHVESLEHYVARLAYICGAPLAPFWGVINAREGVSTRLNPRSMSVHMRGGVDRRLAALIDMTGRPSLVHSTFWRISDAVIMPSHSEMRWCPCCLVEDETLHGQLVWTIPHYTRCVRHGVDIESSCHICGNAQHLAKSYRTYTKCHCCHSELGHRGTRSTANYFREWASKMAFDIVTWIAASPTSEKIPWDSIDVFIKAIFQRFEINKAPRKIQYFLQPHRPGRARRFTHRFSTLLNLAALNAVHPLDILIRPSEAASLPLFDFTKNFIELPFSDNKSPGSSASAIKCLMDPKLLACPYLPSGYEVIKLFQHHPGRFAQLFPDAIRTYRRARMKGITLAGSRSVHRSFRSSISHLKRMDGDIQGIDLSSKLVMQISREINVAPAIVFSTLTAAAICMSHARQLPKRPIQEQACVTPSEWFAHAYSSRSRDVQRTFF